MARRRGLIGPVLPWVFALALVALVGNRLHEALKAGDADLVAHAEELRKGDPDNEIDKAPILALHILDPLLERDPDHYPARLAAARAWADLKSYDKAVGHLMHAASVAASISMESTARRMAIHYLILDDRYDDAVDQALAVVELQPGRTLPPLQLGSTLYRSSVAAQADVRVMFVDSEMDPHEVEIERRIETYITDLWGDPEVEPLVTFLAADADRDFRDDVQARLVDARTRFLQASEAMADYRYFDGFDAQVSQAYCELLLRSGRIFEASVEAAIALRNDKLPLGTRRILREVRAEAAVILGEPSLAADRYDRIVDEFETQNGFVPPRFAAELTALRVEAGQWDWILANDRRMRAIMGDDVWWVYARSRALAATGQVDDATAQLGERFTAVSLGARMPQSMRSDPDRRRDVLMFAHLLFAAAGDSRARDALDSLLDAYPDDLEARRSRAALLREQGLLEGAMEDAFRLLTDDRRDAADFELWLGIADQLSRQRFGAGLEDRARARIDDERNLTRAAVAAAFESSRVGAGGAGGAVASVGAFPSQDPALALHVVEQRVVTGDLERARNDARQLVQAHPQVQEFRYRLGRLLVREGKLDSAAREFLEIVEAVPGDTECLDLAMRVEIALGHDEDAADLVNDMILRDPLGTGAVRFARKLLEDGLPQRADRLLERLVKRLDTAPGLDVMVMAARAKLEQDDIDGATSLLTQLAQVHPGSSDVALLGIEVGLAHGIDGLVDAAVTTLRPLSAGLFPDQVEELADRLVEARRYDDLLRVFPTAERGLPALAAARRPLALAAKSVGGTTEADRLLELVDDAYSLRDRFLLMALDGRAEEATRALRLSSMPLDRRDELDLCVLVGDALDGDRVLADAEPTARLRELGAEADLSGARLELLDASLRLLPSVEQLEKVRPVAVVNAPLQAYPRAGEDVQRLVDLARADPEAAEQALSSLALMLLAGERPFWSRETRVLAEHVLAIEPALETPTVLLAARWIEAEDPRRALGLLRQVLTDADPDLEALGLFLQASRQFGKEEWGLGLGLVLGENRPEVRLALADGLVEAGRPEEALPLYDQLLTEAPTSKEALSGALEAHGLLRRDADVVEVVRTLVAAWPEDDELVGRCARALAEIVSPAPEVVELMDQVAAMAPDEHLLAVARARAYEGDPERVETIVGDMLARMTAAPVRLGTPEARQRTLQLMAAAGTARRTGLPEVTRALNTQALRFQPGNVMFYRELAFLELEAGHLDLARRYLEVLSFVDRADKEPPLALARLLFEQVGQPHLAAQVIREAYPHSMPPTGVEILAAEAFLREQVDDALAFFGALANNPLVTPETILDAARMAYAAGRDPAAATTLDLFLVSASKDHPARPRAEALRTACITDEVAAAP